MRAPREALEVHSARKTAACDPECWMRSHMVPLALDKRRDPYTAPSTGLIDRGRKETAAQVIRTAVPVFIL